MSYLVLHMQKFKKNDVQGIQNHNQREQKSKTNFNINITKSHLNYDLKNKEKISYNEKIKGIIKENVVTNRAIRKDAVVMCNFIISSDKNFFDNLTKQDQKEFFKKSYEFFAKRHGEEKIVSAQIHLDEKTPHMHLSLVPVTEDKKLSAKRLFDRKELRALQDELPNFLNQNGFKEIQRGEDAEGKNKHVEIQQFKALTLDKHVNTLECQLNALKSDLNTFENAKISMSAIENLEGKKNVFSNKISISENDFNNLKNIAKKHLFIESQAYDLKRQNSNLKNRLEFSEQTNKEKYKIINTLKNENEMLEKDNKSMLDFIVYINQADNFMKYEKKEKKREQLKKNGEKKSKQIERE